MTLPFAGDLKVYPSRVGHPRHSVAPRRRIHTQAGPEIAAERASKHKEAHMSYNDSVAPEPTHIDAHGESVCKSRGLRMCAKMYITIFAAFPLLAIGDASAADATERTVMPDFCSRRDVNCVLPDATGPRAAGAPSVATQPVESTQTTPARAGFTQSGSAASTTTVVIQPDASGVTTVITPSSSGLPSVSTVPAPSAPAPTATTGGTASGATSSSASSASGTATSSGSISNGGTTASGTASGGAGFGGSR